MKFIKVDMVEALVDTMDVPQEYTGLGGRGLTSTMINMQAVITGLEAAGIRAETKVIIGGAPVTAAFAEKIGADGYAPDAAASIDLVDGLLGKQPR